MPGEKYKAATTSVTSTVENRKRKEVLVEEVAIFSQKFDFSDLIGMDPEKKFSIKSMPYEFLKITGEIIAKGMTDEQGETGRVFTSKKEDLILFLGDGEWTLSLDCKHDF